jgi:hypothetical protein
MAHCFHYDLTQFYQTRYHKVLSVVQEFNNVGGFSTSPATMCVNGYCSFNDMLWNVGD